MTRDDIMRMAREAGIVWDNHTVVGSEENLLEHFAALVAAWERDQAEAEWRYLMVEVRKVGEQALEALENPWNAGPEGVANAITALRAKLNGRAFVRGDL